MDDFNEYQCLVNLGRVLEKMIIMQEALDLIDLSKHNPLFEIDDEKTYDFVYDELRGSLISVKKMLNDSIFLLKKENQDD